MKYNVVQGHPIVGYEFGNEPNLFISAINATGELAATALVMLAECVSTAH